VNCFFSLLFKSQSKIQANKDLDTLANNKFDIPGESGFPMNAVYGKPSTRSEEGVFSFILS
jgi:actin related protein 2/3 complex subunit 3